MQSQTKDKLGEGVQGCVLRGTLMLSNDPINTTKYTTETELGQVTKLIIDESIFKRESENTRIINKLDGGKYAMEITATSVLTQSDIQYILERNQNILQKINLCQSISKSLRSIKYLYQIIYKHEGASLLSLNLTPEQMLKYCYNLYEGVQFFQANKYLHYDIKIDNILYIKDRFVFIDFGQSSKVHELNLSYISQIPNDYAKYFLHDPPELLALAVMNYARLDRERSFELFKKIYEHNLISNTIDNYNFKELIINNIYNGNKTQYLQSLKSLFYNMYKLSPEEREAFVRKYIYYADLYKLSMTMLELFIYNNYVHMNHKLVADFFMNVVCKSLFINPNKRESIHNICKSYQALHTPVSSTQLQSRAKL